MANHVQVASIHVDETTKLHVTNHYWLEHPRVRRLMGDVEGVTNRPMLCSRDWEIYYPQLDKLYGDAQHTIHAVTEAIVAWCEAIIGLVTDESNWKWKNELFRNVDRRNERIRLKIKIYQAESPSVVWSEEDLGFVLFIPEANVMDLSGLVRHFKDQLLSAFDSDELYHIPKAQYINGPSELLLRPPYYLTIQASPTYITVQSSHSPSLKFLAEYLREHESKEEAPVIDIKLHQNLFTPKESAIYDNLTLNADPLPGGPVNRISPLMLVRLVENELGYEMDNRNQNSRYFCRREPLEEPPEEPPKAV
ncbi:hypothetical protein CI102_9357 [Trichoderma harzianum]|nr:hypothetical protein CI102_9357 [Trichoderma harzianum]